MLTPGAQVRWWLLWAAWPYGLVATLRARLYRRGWLPTGKLPVPVISIGNLTVGGTGKTPVVLLLAEWLSAEGKRVAILSRGYRRVGREAMLVVSNGERLLASEREAGDEPYLMAKRCPSAVVAVGADRYELGRWVLAQFPVDCILLDDGFQHLGLYRDVNLLLVDATDPAGLDAVVPAGRLREPLSAAARASMVLITRADHPAGVGLVLDRLRGVIDRLPPPAQLVFRAEGLVSLTKSETRPPQWCRGRTAVLCSGIGHAPSFRAMAESLGLRVLEELVYADHHRYTDKDVGRIRARASALQADLIVTTEKDAGKLSSRLDDAENHWWAVRLGVEFIAGEERLRRLLEGEGQTLATRGRVR